ncbi:hypothetical protein N7520_001054 [Penicillium odoratum]|uniref:uncharacterized protein n=1 Tax=Penicillium odoratum TaxID=1167516 RepID=UPI00254906F4|nr:uncharacterized protein N7520_001054 [Penicillium odoratum]KAJ5777808.1 hypothetical protein N7520_001054 [Penicillium odoratum]
MNGVSVAASVVGLLQLGLQVFQTLIDFYYAYKNQDTDVSRASEKLQGLAVLSTLRFKNALFGPMNKT